MSAEGQAVVEEQGYIPVGDAPEYTADAAASGNIVVGGSSSVSPLWKQSSKLTVKLILT